MALFGGMVSAEMQLGLGYGYFIQALPKAVPAANLLIAQAEGRISQYVRSDFKRLPTEYWEDQWTLLSGQLFRNASQPA